MNCLKHVGAFALGLVLIALATQTAHAQITIPTDARDAYDKAMQAKKDGKINEALAALNTAILAEGSYVDAYIAKGDILKDMEAYQEAALAYSRALEIDVNSAAAYNGRGECFMEANPPDFNMAINDFTNALNLDRSNPKALSNMGHALVSSGQTDPSQSLIRLDEALAVNPDDPRAHRDRGLAHAQLNEFEKATEDLKKAVELDPKDYENFQTLAAIDMIQERYADAVDAYSKAIETYTRKHNYQPENYISGYLARADARFKLAEVLAGTDADGRTAALQGAVSDADAVLAIYPDKYPEAGQALFRKGKAERNLERYSDGVDTLTQAIQVVPDGQDAQYVSEAHLFKGICYFYIGSLELARGDFEAASSTGQGFQDARIFLWLGYTYHKDGDIRRAIEYYNQAIAKSPEFALAYVNKGRAYMDLKEYKKAVDCFNYAILSEPGVGEHYYNVGVADIKLGEYQKAVDFLNLALRKGNPPAKYYSRMAEALRGLRRNQLAAEYDQKAAAVAPKKAS